MNAPFKTWTVLPHGKLQAIDENILTVVGDIHMPIGDFPRRMTVVRLSDGRLVIYSAIALDEDEMAALEDYGAPAFLVVPSDRHRMDAPAWKSRYPAITVLTPSGARAKVQEVVAVDASDADFGDASVRLIDVPGTQHHEVALEITAPGGLTLVVNEIIGDIHGAKGVRGWLLRLMGFAGEEPHVPAPVKAQFAKGAEELAAQFRRWADMPALQRIIVSHGDIIDADPRGALRHLADTLGPEAFERNRSEG
jgi:hypothetical protein